ncbi:hypothetical protein [Aeromicrobium sp. CF3.5]|uniref:hypothetical protein n=1 Tax=Aeromicrobium sp. CF3.5 TaxID=3373078 RepID=UPI003EE442C1
MNRPILDHFLQRAAEVAEVADLVQSGDPNGRSIFTLQPLREGAAPVIVSTWKGSDAQEIEYGVPFCEAESLDGPVEVDLEIVDDYVDTAIDGRLWVAFGLDRGLLGIISSTGVESRVTTYDGLRSLIPLPGWKKRAKKRRYLPYLS